MSVKIDIKELFAAGAHFGHKSSRWHPKMAPYIHSRRGGSHIIDLVQTVEALEKATEAVEATVASGKQVLFVGTKHQAADTVKEMAEQTGMPYVTERWLGGMLTNHKTMNQRIKHLVSLEEKMESGELAQRYNKLEVQRFQEEIDQLNVVFGGVKSMQGMPGMLFVTDINNDDIAVKEANKLNIPVLGIVDTNCDPRSVTLPVPCNDDAIKAIKLVCGYVAQAIANGKQKQKSSSPDKKGETTESAKSKSIDSSKKG